MEGKRKAGQGEVGKRERSTGGKGENSERPACEPLDIKRYRKDDGRTLILYTLRKHEEGI